jgi:hypothetical protein
MKEKEEQRGRKGEECSFIHSPAAGGKGREAEAPSFETNKLTQATPPPQAVNELFAFSHSFIHYLEAGTSREKEGRK